MNDYELLNNTCINACDIQNKNHNFTFYSICICTTIITLCSIFHAYLICEKVYDKLYKERQRHQEELEEHTNQILDAIYENCRVEFYKNAEKNTDELKSLLYRYKM